MSPMEFKEVLWLLMLIPLGIVLSAGVLFACSAARWMRDHKLRNQLSQFDMPESLLMPPKKKPLFIEKPTLWLAIKGTDVVKVQAALGVHDTISCSWEEGLIEAREHKLFISPPVLGWILVVGSDLPEAGDDVDRCFLFLIELSRKVGHLQYFCANRALNQHAWAIVDRGQVFRAYAWAETTLWNQGPVTAAERELGLACFPYGMWADYTEREATVSNTEKVNLLAARWSLDPAAVAENAWNTDRGIVGEFTPPHSH